VGLEGKRVLVTRAEHQAEKLGAALRRAGAKPVAVPVIRIAPPSDPGEFERAVANAGDFDWLIFTSVNGVEAFFEEREKGGAPARGLPGHRVAAIGPATAAALEKRGVAPDVVPPEYRGESVAEAIVESNGGGLSGVSLLIPRAAGAREALPRMLREAGGRVEVVDAYRMLIPGDREVRRLTSLLENGEIDVITFTSSSTVTHTADMLGENAERLLNGLIVASIGPITTRTAWERGLRVDVTATEYTVEGLVGAMKEYFER
jgi:uroporphyrinogen III methyltransferase/synthase